MSKGCKTVLFAFSVADRREARLWLEYMAEQGWELVRVKGKQFPRAVFQPLERSGLRYDVDIADNAMKNYFQQQEYAQFLSDAGWDEAGELNGLKFYKSRPGFSPAPIQTDPELERKRYWKERFVPDLLSTLLGLALIALVVLIPILSRAFHLFSLLRSNFLLLTWAVLLVYLSLSLFIWVWSAWRRRRADRLPVASAFRWARIRGVLQACSTLLVLLTIPLNWGSSLYSLTIPDPSDETFRSWPVALAEDFGVEDAYTYGLVQADSVLLHSVQIRSWFPVDDTSRRMTEERFDCTYGWVADLVVSGLLNDEDDYTPAELGFDESYQDGENNLLLRQGNTVVRLEAPFDLTTGTALAVLRDRLEWEG